MITVRKVLNLLAMSVFYLDVEFWRR